MERRRSFKKEKEAIEASEQEIIVGLITSTEYISAIREYWNPLLIENSIAKFMAQMCLTYYDTYKEAPRGNFEKLFLHELKVRPNDSAMEWYEELHADEPLSRILKEGSNKETNVQFLVDGTRARFARRHYDLHVQQVNMLYGSGQIEAANKLSKEFEPIEFGSSNKIEKYVWSVDDMESHNRELPELFMSPWLRAGQLTFIYSEAGTGKSLLAINIAYLLGLEEFDNKDCEIGEWQVKSQTGCLYVDGEMGEQEMRDRIRQFEWVGKQREDIKIMIMAVPEYQLATEDPFMLSVRENQRCIINWLKEHQKYKLLILDSVTTLFGLEEENDNSEWNKKIQPFFRDLKALDVACIILHHSGKDINRGLRGASSMAAMAHNNFKLENHPEKDVADGEAWFSLSRGKQRTRGFLFKDFTITYFQESGLDETRWRIGDEQKKQKEIFSSKEIRILKRLHQGWKGTEVAKLIGCTRQYVSETRTRAIKFHYFTSDMKPTPLWDELMNRNNNNGEAE